VKRAIISDIHANYEALQAVLEDIRRQDISSIYCLGDIIGYGPNPCECIDEAMKFDVCLLGNHDQAALFDPEGFSSGAERAIHWTRDVLESASNDPQVLRTRWEFLCELPRNRREDGLLFVHGSARNPLNEYVFPEDIYNRRKLNRIFAMFQGHCFQGHTHVPGVFTPAPAFLHPNEIGEDGFRLEPTEKTMINVGSVGQPRDGDPRACYVVLDENLVTFRRVVYPVAKTAEKIHAIADLDSFLGDRLMEGR
jgi:diadenosine tetraphosphatase ApaH/serine/threonine PP2A family protein phosphatase